MSNVYPLIKGFSDSIKHSWEDIFVPKLSVKPSRVIIVGMGANYNAGLLLKEMLRDEIEVAVYQREFILGKDDLVVFLSYSGNTNEVIGLFKKFGSKRSVVVSSGGKLLKLAKKKKAQIIEVPSKLHSRFTFAECYFSVLKCLGISGIIKDKKNIVRKILMSLNKNDGKIEKEAQHLAKIVHDKKILVYSSEYFWPVAYRFSSSLAEDIKRIAHPNRITELFHNELEALPSKEYFPIIFVDKKETVFCKGQIDFFKKKLVRFFYFGYENCSREERTFLGFLLAYYLAFYLSNIYKNKVPMGETPSSDEIKKK